MINPQELPQFIQNPDQATALNCSKCGAPAQRGAPMCMHCGSGLNSELSFDINLLRSKFVELDWKSELNGSRLGDAIDLAIGIGKERNEDVFFIFKDIPVVVKLGMETDLVLENWRILSKMKDRDAMGDRWYKALEKFHRLQERLGGIDPDDRQKVKDNLYGGPEWSNRYMPDLSFFTTVSFGSMENLMSFLPGDDADTLIKMVDEINEAIEALGI